MIQNAALNRVFDKAVSRGFLTDGLLARNWLKGSEGDTIHAVLCGAGHNLRLIQAHLRVLLLALVVLTRYAGNPLWAAWQAMTPILGAALRLPVPARFLRFSKHESADPGPAADHPSFEKPRPPTRREQFLATMDSLVPWRELCAAIEPHYPKAGNGRPPVGLERMMRMYFVQHWFNLADEACEEALVDSTSLRRFVGIDPGCERVPDGATLPKFRRLIEDKRLGQALFAKVGEVLQARGLKLGSGTIVDATIISAPSSTKKCQSAA